MTYGEWLDREADLAAARQRTHADAAKLVATFVAGIAATLVATALQVGEPSRKDTIAVWSLAAAIAAAIAVVLLDRIVALDTDLIVSRAMALKWDDQTLISELRWAYSAAVRANDAIVHYIRIMLVVQIAISIWAGLIAAASLLE